jgi:hypothetical protein
MESKNKWLFIPKRRKESMQEPTDDENTIELAKEMENVRLIVDLLIYSKKLEEMVIELRKDVNSLSPKGQPKPYEEVHSDVYESFYDYPAYEKYKEYIDLLIEP